MSRRRGNPPFGLCVGTKNEIKTFGAEPGSAPIPILPRCLCVVRLGLFNMLQPSRSAAHIVAEPPMPALGCPHRRGPAYTCVRLPTSSRGAYAHVSLPTLSRGCLRPLLPAHMVMELLTPAMSCPRHHRADLGHGRPNDSVGDITSL